MMILVPMMNIGDMRATMDLIKEECHGITVRLVMGIGYLMEIPKDQWETAQLLPVVEWV